MRFTLAGAQQERFEDEAQHGGILTVHGEEARLLITLEPAGAEYFFVPRDDSDADPARFGVIIQDAAPAM